MVKGKQFGALLMAAVMSVTGISVPQSVEAATPSAAQNVQDDNGTAHSLSADVSGLKTLVEFDFEPGNVLTTDDLQSVDGKARAKSFNGYELVDGKDGGKALKLDKAKKQYLSLSYAPGAEDSFILKGKDEITISYDLKDAPDSWVVYADKNTEQNRGEGDENYLGVIGANTVERYRNGRNYGTTSSNTTINNAPTNGWRHWDIVVANDYTKVYVDGVLYGDSISKSRLSEILGDNGVLYLGAANWGGTPGEFGSFTMDNFKISEGIAEVGRPQKPGILAELDFEAERQIQGGDFVTDTLKATQHNSYEIVEGNGGGRAIKIDAAKKQYLSLTKPDGTPILSGKNVVTLSYDLNGGANSWVVYADKDANQNVYQKENYVAVSGTNELEYYYNGRPNNADGTVKSAGSRVITFSNPDTTPGWHHWDIEISYGYIKVYEDGVLKGQTPGNSQQKLADILGNASVLYLGAANWGATPGEYGSFTMDNFRIYDGQQVEYLKSLVSGVEAQKKEVEMVAGSDVTEQMELVLPEDLKSCVYQVVYASSDDTIATVDATGKITAVAAGTADITATVSMGDAQKEVKTTVTCVTAEQILARQAQKDEIKLNTAKAPARVGDTGEITVDGLDARIANHPELEIVLSSDSTALVLTEDTKVPGKAKLEAKQTADAAKVTATITIGTTTITVEENLKIDGRQVAAYDFEKEDGAEDKERLKNKADADKYAKAWGGEENNRTDLEDSAVTAANYEQGFKSASALRLKDFGLRLNTGKVGDEYTVSAWMKSDTESRLSVNQSVLALGGFAADDSWISLSGAELGAGNVRVLKSDGTTAAVAPSDVFADREWHMVTVTGKDGKVNIYVDGTLVAEDVEAANLLTKDSSDIYLGVAKSYHLFGGLVDNVAVYKGARTQKQIAEEALQETVSWEQIKGENTAQDSVSSDLVLPKKLFKADITWKSSDETVLTSAGKVVAQLEAKDVTLTATVPVKAGNVTITYKLKVVPSNAALLAKAEKLFKTYKDEEKKIETYKDYTQATWDVVETSYRAVTDGKDLPLAELKALVDAFEKNVKALVEIAGLRNSYQAVVDANYDEKLYMEDAWSALQKAQADAKDILDKDAAKENIAKETIDAAKKALDMAAGALQKKAGLLADFSFEEATLHPDGGFFCRDNNKTMIRANGKDAEKYNLVEGAEGNGKAVSLKGTDKQYLLLRNEAGEAFNVLKDTENAATISYDLYNGAANQVLYVGTEDDFLGIFAAETLQAGGEEVTLTKVPTEGWHRWDIVVTDASTKVYVDGTQVGAGKSAMAAITAADAKIYVGTVANHTATTGEYGTFVMDNFRLYQGCPAGYIDDDAVKNGCNVNADVKVTPAGKTANVNLRVTGLAAEAAYTVAYSSDYEEIKVDKDGKISATADAEKNGVITTTVYCAGHEPVVLKTTVTLNDAAATLTELGFKAEKVEASILPGWSKQMRVEIPVWIRKDKSCKLTYVSDNEAAVVDENGMVTAVKAGRATITAVVSVEGEQGKVEKTMTCAILDVKAGEIGKFDFNGNLNDTSVTPDDAASVYHYPGDNKELEYEEKGLFGKAVKLVNGGVDLNRKNVGNVYTVSVWMKKDEALANNHTALFLGYNNPERWVSVAGDNASKAKIWARQSADKNKPYYNHTVLTQVNNFCDGTWHNLTFVGEAGKISFYLDGKLIVTKDNNDLNPLNGANQDIRLGATYWSGDGYSGGLATRARVYNAMMTDAQLYDTLKADGVEALRNWIAQAEDKRKDPTYTTVSRKKLDAACEAAIALTKAERPEIAELMAAQKELQNAIEGLVNLDELKELIAKAQGYKATVNSDKEKVKYSEASLAVYNREVDAALENAQGIMEREEDWTTKQVADTVAALKNAEPAKAMTVKPDGPEWLVSVEALKGIIKNANDRLTAVRKPDDTYKVYTAESRNNYCAKLEEQKNAADALVKSATTKKAVTDQEKKLQDALNNTALLARIDVMNNLRKQITDALKDTGNYDKKHTEQTNKDHVGEFVYTAISRKAVEDAIAKLNDLNSKLPLDTSQKMQDDVAAALTAFATAKNNLTEVDYNLYDEAQKVLDEVGKLKEEDYTADSWKVLSDACKALSDMLPNMTDADELKNAKEAVANAKEALISIVDLKGVIDDFKVKYIEDQYTKASWAEYQKVMDEAEKVLKDPAETADHIAFVKNKLELAPGVLVSVVELKAAIDNATGVDYTKYPQADYSAASWNAYHKVCEDAKALLTTEEAVTSQQIAQAIDQIKSAVDNLTTTVPLQKAIADAEATYTEDLYTGASWEKYQAALNAAKQVLAKENATNAEIQEAIQNLNKAIDALVSPDKLADVIENAENQGYQSTDFTAGSWDAYEAALLAAKEVAANPNATSAEIGTAIADLTRAKDALVSTVSLKKAIDDANEQNFNENNYTPESWAQYKKALDEAVATLNDKPSATNADIENVTANLKSAVKNLQPVVFDDSDANAAIRRAEALYEGDYTANSYQAVSTALNELKALLASDKVNEATVRPAIVKLNEAMEDLVSIVTLKEDIQTVQNLNYSQRQYTAASWAEYSAALQYAQDTVVKADATKSEVAKAVSDLNMGIRGLVSIADLTEAIQTAVKEGYRAGDYTKSTWENYQTALENAQKVVVKEDATRIEVKNAAEALESAMNHFVYVADLNTAIANAQKTYVQSKYTDASWKVYSQALAAAKSVAAKADASESDIAAAKQALSAAISKLAVKPATVKPETLKINIKKATIGVKEALTLKVTGATSKISYKSSNKKVATVGSKGKVTGKKTGKATITAATAKGKKITCTITVKKAPKKVTLNKKKVTLTKGKTFKIKVKLPKNTASYKKTYKSSNKKVATVSKSGTIKAVKKGKAVITVKTFNKKTAKIQITVK